VTRRILVFTTLLLAAGLVIYFWPAGRRVNGGAGDTAVPAGAGPVRPGTPPPVPPAPPPIARDVPPPRTAAPNVPDPTQIASDFPIAAPLNAPDSTIARDLDVVRQLFEAWLSNFPREGNPIGENAEITAALMGENRLGLALIPRGHRAVNERGELCDRWGTPFRFHQLSGTQMEVRSAGPDRKFATADDALLTPP